MRKASAFIGVSSRKNKNKQREDLVVAQPSADQDEPDTEIERKSLGKDDNWGDDFDDSVFEQDEEARIEEKQAAVDAEDATASALEK